MDYRQRPWPIVGAAAGVVVALAVAGYWYFGRGDAEPDAPPQAAVEAPRPVPPAPTEPVEPDPAPFVLPGLDDSDGVLRDLIAGLSAHPGLAVWLVTDDLIRTFVVTVDNVADGSNPSRHVPFTRPDSRLETTGQAAELRIDTASFRRYDDLTQIVVSLDTNGSAELYRQLLPLMDEAYAELGSPDVAFTDTFHRAVSHLLETPVIEGQPTLVPRATLFEYTDDSLQSLSPAQKQLLLMGPDNLRTVQAAIRDIALSIGLGDLPRGSVLLR